MRAARLHRGVVDSGRSGSRGVCAYRHRRLPGSQSADAVRPPQVGGSLLRRDARVVEAGRHEIIPGNQGILERCGLVFDRGHRVARQ